MNVSRPQDRRYTTWLRSDLVVKAFGRSKTEKCFSQNGFQKIAFKSNEMEISFSMSSSEKIVNRISVKFVIFIDNLKEYLPKKHRMLFNTKEFEYTFQNQSTFDGTNLNLSSIVYEGDEILSINRRSDDIIVFYDHRTITHIQVVS